MNQNPVYILDALRSPVGRLYGSLSNCRPDDLMVALCERHKSRFFQIEPQALFLGCANQAGEDNRNIARQVALLSGYSPQVRGESINTLCSSGLDSLIAAARCLRLNEGDYYLAGAVESMSRSPWVEHRYSQERCDTTIGWRFVNPRWQRYYEANSMVQTVELLSRKLGLGREAQDAYACESRLRYEAALLAGHWAHEQVALHTERFALVRDEQHRLLQADTLSKLPPMLPDGFCITLGNSSRAGDGAALVALASERGLAALEAKPLAQILAWSQVALHPDDMGLGAAKAIEALLQKQHLQIKDIDYWDISESFAAQALAVQQSLALDPQKVNVLGGSLSIGNPTAMGSLRQLVTLCHLPHFLRHKPRYGVAACGAGLGLGTAVLIQWLD